MVEWTTGVKYWTGLLECHAHKIILSLFHGLILGETTEKQVWGAMPNPGTQTRSKVKNISSKVTSHTDSKAGRLV